MINNKIDYFRRCYRADSNDLALSNIKKIRNDRLIFQSQEDVLASGTLPRLPIIENSVEDLVKQIDQYQRERLLIYGCLFIIGSVSSQGFSRTRKIYSPLIYFPAHIHRDEHYFLEIENSDARVNVQLLRLLLKSDKEPSVVDDFPNKLWPLNSETLSNVGEWLKTNTNIINIEEIGRWPQLSNDCSEIKHSLVLRSQSCMALVDRSRGVRGVLHELNQLVTEPSLSQPLRELLGASHGIRTKNRSTPGDIPALLNSSQKTALINAAQNSTSMISGPPGTGKSYTIAAIAIDRLINGETILVTAKTEQAVKVVAEKLKIDFGLDNGIVLVNQRSTLRQLKDFLVSLLKHGVADSESPKLTANKLQRSIKNRAAQERRFEKLLWALKHTDSTTSILKRALSAFLRKKYGDDQIWSCLEELNKAQQDFEAAAISHLNEKRNSVLRQLLNTHRGELVTFNSAIRARNSKSQAERFSDCDLNTVLKAFPIWLVKSDDVHSILPLNNGMFDCVIFDEASQCDLASALPVVQRGKRAIYVGDAKQLRHVSFLSSNKQVDLWTESGNKGDLPNIYSYRDESLLDIASHAIESQKSICMLEEHFRSKPELISFSNQLFYDGRLKVMKSRPLPSQNTVLDCVKVEGKRSNAGRNEIEKNAILDQVADWISRHQQTTPKPSLGILSPYREQAEYIDRELRKRFSTQDIHQYNIRSATPFGFQGEERDYMILSMVVDNSSRRAAAYLNRADMFNVAVTRAKERQTVYHSIDTELLSENNLLRVYIETARSFNTHKATNKTLCDFANDVISELENRGCNTWLNFGLAGQDIDIVCEKSGTTIGIDLIDIESQFGEYYSLDIYKVMRRAGLIVVPLPKYLWSTSRANCLKKIEHHLM